MSPSTPSLSSASMIAGSSAVYGTTLKPAVCSVATLRISLLAAGTPLPAGGLARLATLVAGLPSTSRLKSGETTGVALPNCCACCRSASITRTPCASSRSGLCGERSPGCGDRRLQQPAGARDVQDERPELVADPERAVRRLLQRLGVEVGPGEQALPGEEVDDRPRHPVVRVGQVDVVDDRDPVGLRAGQVGADAVDPQLEVGAVLLAAVAVVEPAPSSRRAAPRTGSSAEKPCTGWWRNGTCWPAIGPGPMYWPLCRAAGERGRGQDGPPDQGGAAGLCGRRWRRGQQRRGQRGPGEGAQAGRAFQSSTSPSTWTGRFSLSRALRRTPWDAIRHLSEQAGRP